MAEDRKMIDELRMELNSLGKNFAEMNNEMKHLYQHAQEERTTSTEYRRDMRQEVHALRMEQAHSNLQMVGLKQDVGAVKADVSDLSAKVGTIEETRQQGVGAGRVVIVLARLLYAIGGAVVAGIVWIVTTMLQGPRP